MRRAVVCAVVALALTSPAAALAHRGAPRIVVLSNRADLISGGDALVTVTPRSARVRLNGADVTAQLQARRGRLVGVVTGLVDGRNRLVAHTRRGRTTRITTTDHPIGAPSSPPRRGSRGSARRSRASLRRRTPSATLRRRPRSSSWTRRRISSR